jgi:two-component system LytT family response regulator
MIRCVVIDDEPWAVDLLVSYIKKVNYLSLSLATNSPLEALSYLSQHTVDLVFLDINMPEMTGVQMMEIMDNKIPVVITSAYPEYAINGFDYNVVDYLLKPIEFERFLKGLLKAVQSITSRSALAEDKSLMLEKKTTRDFLFIKTDGKLIRVKYDEILYIEGKRDYISITTTVDKLISLDTLSNMELILPSDTFIRIHKSYIVALDKINFIQGNRVCIKDDYLPIGDTYKNNVLNSTKT